MSKVTKFADNWPSVLYKVSIDHSASIGSNGVVVPHKSLTLGLFIDPFDTTGLRTSFDIESNTSGGAVAVRIIIGIARN